jgi:uncharacterized membrane protein
MNLSYFNNLPPIELNITQQVTSEELIPNIISSANETSGGYFGLGVMLITFLVMTIILYKQDGDIRLDIMRSMFISSGLSLILGVVMILSGLTTSLQHIIWFLVLFVILIFVMYGIKKKGL